MIGQFHNIDVNRVNVVNDCFVYLLFYHFESSLSILIHVICRSIKIFLFKGRQERLWKLLVEDDQFLYDEIMFKILDMYY